MRTKFFLHSALLLSILIPSSFADSVSQLVVFGDSLSDTGNVAIATLGAFPGPNYWNGRYTNGPTTTPATNSPIGLAVDQLAAKLGVADPQPFLANTGGTDYAFASAQTGSNGLFNITDQINYFTAANKGVASPSALYAIWGGANDAFNGSGNPITAADSLAGNIQALAAEGGKTFLWTNLPPLGLTPRGASDPAQAALLNGAAQAFNAEWSADIAKLQGQGINVIGVDVYSLFLQIAANPQAYGFANITDAAQGLANVNPNTYLFWDQEHPTTAGDALVANLAFNDLEAATPGIPTPTPEPGSMVFTALGMAGLLAAGRIRATRRSAGRQASK